MKIDVLIIGAGIAGLWTLSRLRAAGYDAWLVESDTFGGVQSIASQGIIHGGSKYALGGKLGDSAQAIGEMPAIWEACLQGQGEIDLSKVEVHTPAQLMWTTPSFTSKVAGFFADKLMQSRMQKLTKQDYPEPFNHEAYDGDVYQLNEPVLNTASLMSVLKTELGNFCLNGRVRFEAGNPTNLSIEHDEQAQPLTLETSQVILAAGLGNEKLLGELGRDKPLMQKRPLHMVVVKSQYLPWLFAHCLGKTATPRMTITTTQKDNDIYWYVGGEIAESGIHRNQQQQIEATQKEFHQVLPWLDFSDCKWSSFMIDRAEIQTQGNKRPDNAFVEADNSVMTVWPTKLAFAPRVAQEVLKCLEQLQTFPAGQAGDVTSAYSHMSEWPRAPLGDWPWLNLPWQPGKEQ